MTLKLGGLFSGVGGFELAWTRLGGEVAWMCEYDKNAQKVLRERFPNVPIYDDVRDLDPSQVEAVDVLTGGSPCQGFSVAGTRSGLEHGESRLFADYIRIMEGLAERGLQFALWENVPGVLSIQNDDGEMTFEHVVAALVGAGEPVRLDRNVRWNTGMAARPSRAVAWRVLDSRYFGVAQRRRRIFACVAFGHSCEDRAGRTLLAVSKSVQRDSAPFKEPRQDAAHGVGNCVGDASVTGRLDVVGPLTTGGLSSPRGSETSDSGWVFPDTPELMRKVRSDDFVGDDTSSTLAARDHKDYGDLVVEPTVCVQGSVVGRKDKNGPGGSGWKHEETYTLTAFDSHAVTVPLQDTRGLDKKQNGLGVGNPGDPSFTLDATSRAGVALPVDDDEVAVDFGRTSDRIRINAETAATLQAGGGGAGAKTGLYMTDYGVRRLTPVECERLQAFPDGWTEPAGSDSARYKAMGNAVTVNVVQWILRRVLDTIENY